MNEQLNKGVLYVVPTPIGNLDDITIRAVNTLQDVDGIAAEDTRHTQKLLNHLQIKQKLISYHEHNKRERTKQIIQMLVDGQNIALVSDAGMPAISDPGYELVVAAIDANVEVTVLPGANAAICALVGSGLPTDEFLFYGFLPRKKQAMLQVLERLATYEATLIFYESPYRIKQTVRLMASVFGNRKLALVRELTKLYEQYIRGTADEVLSWVEENDVKGECCIIVEGTLDNLPADKAWWSELTIEEHMAVYEEEKSMPHKLALKQVAVDRNVPKREIYHHLHVEK